MSRAKALPHIVRTLCACCVGLASLAASGQAIELRLLHNALPTEHAYHVADTLQIYEGAVIAHGGQVPRTGGNRIRGFSLFFADWDAVRQSAGQYVIATELAGKVGKTLGFVRGVDGMVTVYHEPATQENGAGIFQNRVGYTVRHPDIGILHGTAEPRDENHSQTPTHMAINELGEIVAFGRNTFYENGSPGHGGFFVTILNSDIGNRIVQPYVIGLVPEALFHPTGFAYVQANRYFIAAVDQGTVPRDGYVFRTAPLITGPDNRNHRADRMSAFPDMNITDLDVAPSGNVVIAGSQGATVGPGGRVVALDEDLSLLWSKEFTEPGYELRVTNVEVMENGDVIVAADAHPAQAKQDDAVRGWIARYSSDGASRLWRRFFDSDDGATTQSLAIFGDHALIYGQTGLRIYLARTPLNNIGDVDNDGTVGAVDVQLVINAALGLPIDATIDADINRDGVVNAVDVQLTITEALGVQ